MARVLFMRSSHDIASDYLHDYTGELVKYARGEPDYWGNPGLTTPHTVLDYAGDAATQINFKSAIMDWQPDIAILAGHGNPTTMTAQDLAHIIETGKPTGCTGADRFGSPVCGPDVLDGRKGYLMACGTAAQLGPAMVEDNACLEYYGWAADFVFVYDDYLYSKGQRLDDQYAHPFFDSALTAGRELLNGTEPWKIYGLTLGRYTYWWNEWMKSNDDLSDDVLTWLEWDKANFRALTPTGIYAGQLQRLSWEDLMPVAIGVGSLSVLIYLLSQRKKSKS